MLSDYISLAFRNVRKRGLRSWLTMLGVFIGIAAVVSLISLGQGLETAIIGQFGALSTDTLTIQGADTGFSPPGSTSVRKMTEHDVEIIETVSGIKIVIPRLLRASQIEFNEVIGFSMTVSIPNNREQIDEIIEALGVGVAEGRFLQEGDSGKIVLGDDFVKSELYGKPIRVGSTVKIQGEDFKVAGILERTSTFTLNGAILMMEEDMRSAFDISEDEIDFIVARAESENEIERISEEIKRKLRDDRDQKIGEEDFEVQTPIESLSAVQTIISVINIVVTGIALIALVVGGIGIANTMFTSVLERTREIGVMKAIGAQNKDILTIFLIESGLLGLIGGIAGVLLGIGIGKVTEFIAVSQLGTTLLKVAIPPYLIFGSLAFAFFAGAFSGLWPAWKAMKVRPVEALRYE